MPAFQKRVMSNAEVPAPSKKAKVAVEDPVLTKISTIVAAIQDANFAVPGTDTNRDMLVAIAPSVLATPIDARHEQQQSMGDIFKNLFLNEESRLTERITEAQAKVTEATDALATCKATAAASETALKEKTNELKAKQVEVAEDVQASKDAESTFKELMSEIADLDQIKEIDVEAHEAATNMKSEHFIVMREGSWEGDSSGPSVKDHVKALQSFFRKLHVDASLVAALPRALGCKSTERSEFDSLVVSELEKKLDCRLAELAEKIKGSDAAIAAKQVEKDGAELDLAASKCKQRLSAEALLALKAEQKQLATEQSEKQQVVVEQEYEVRSVEADHNGRQVELKSHQSTLSVLKELLERTTPVPEVTLEEPVAEVATDLVIEPAQEPIVPVA